MFDTKAIFSTTSLSVALMATEENITVPGEGNVSFSEQHIKEIIPCIKCLVSGWRLNISLYGSSYPNDWDETEPTTDDAETLFNYFRIVFANDTTSGNPCPYRIYFNISQGTLGTISPEDIRLFVHNSSWTQLPTVVIDGTSNPAQFYGIPPHFSKFFIGETPTIHTEDPSSPGGGGGSRTIVVEENITETPLFDVRVSIPKKYTVSSCGEEESCEGGELIADIKITDVNKVGLIDITIEYIIKDSLGNIKLRKTETKAIDGELNYIKEIKYPYMEIGQYILEVEVRYNDEFASGSYPFRIIEEGGLEDQTRQLLVSIEKELIIVVGIIITLIIISIIITFSAHKRMESIEKYLKKGGPKTKKDPLVKFIETALSKGISERKIRLALSKKGWKKKMVDDAFKKIKFRSIIKKRKNKKGNF